MTDELRPMFHPQSIAVIGASTDPYKIGGRTFRYLKENWKGSKLYPVNARVPEVQGIPSIPTVADLPEAVDLAFVVIPAAGVPALVEECIARGLKSLVVFSSGFAEVSEEGARAQVRLRDMTREAGIRMAGPNCMGLMNVPQGMWGTFTGSFEAQPPVPGRMSMVSQSGAFGIYCYQVAHARGLGVNLWATTGNEADIDVADCLAYMAMDDDTDVIVAYMEAARNKDKLVHALELARSRRKPVVMLKVGSSEVGAMAAASHTASMVGADAVYDEVFRAHGVHRAYSIEEMVDVTQACLAGIYPGGRKLGIVTVSGGVGVLMADEAERSGLDVPEMPEPAQKKLKELIPFASARNPVDTTAQMLADASLLGKNLDVMLAEGGCDAVLFFLSSVGLNAKTMDEITGELLDARKRHPDGLVGLSGLFKPELTGDLLDGGYQIYQDPNRAVQTVAALAAFGEAFSRPTHAPPDMALAKDFPTLDGTQLDERQGKALLAEIGVPVVPDTLAASAEEAVQAAEAHGYPVVLKVASADVAHKSDAGGVVLGLRDAAAVRAAYDAIMHSVKAKHPQAAIEGVLVSPMVSGGVECIVGIQHDPVFGPVLMFGLGGIFAEIFHDVSLRLAPISAAAAMEMVREIKGYPLLAGARGRPPADVDALCQVLERVSLFAAREGARLQTLDINPLVVFPAGSAGPTTGVMALDALVVPQPAK